MNEVLRNSDVFLKILNMARSKRLQEWNKEAFQRAYNWAEYFEKAHSKLSNRPSLKKTLDSHMRHFIKLNKMTFGGEALGFDSLQKSKDILLKSCLGNVWLSEEQLPYLIELYTSTKITQYQHRLFIDHSFSLSKVSAQVSLLGEMLDRLKYGVKETCKNDPNDSILIDVKDYSDVSMETSARMLVKHIQGQLTETESNDLRDHLSAQLKLISSLDKGFELLLTSILCIPNQNDKARQFILKWITGHPCQKLWECHPSLLSQTAFQSVEFFKVYMKFLLDQNYCHSCLNKLKEHWKHLISGPKHVTEICLKAVQSAMPFSPSDAGVNQAILDLFTME